LRIIPVNTVNPSVTTNVSGFYAFAWNVLADARAQCVTLGYIGATGFFSEFMLLGAKLTIRFNYTNASTNVGYNIPMSHYFVWDRNTVSTDTIAFTTITDAKNRVDCEEVTICAGENMS